MIKLTKGEDVVEIKMYIPDTLRNLVKDSTQTATYMAVDNWIFTHMNKDDSKKIMTIIREHRNKGYIISL